MNPMSRGAVSIFPDCGLPLQSRCQASVHHTREANPTFPGVPGVLRVKTVPGLCKAVLGLELQSLPSWLGFWRRQGRSLNDQSLVLWPLFKKKESEKRSWGPWSGESPWGPSSPVRSLAGAIGSTEGTLFRTAACFRSEFYPPDVWRTEEVEGDGDRARWEVRATGADSTVAGTGTGPDVLGKGHLSLLKIFHVHWVWEAQGIGYEQRDGLEAEVLGWINLQVVQLVYLSWKVPIQSMKATGQWAWHADQWWPAVVLCARAVQPVMHPL